ncbi:NAD(P)-binding domain-containing protein [Svornostia abyssi]|uniref:NAD(P)-binding domain-containing protein n=1 Tax=Svornostia abyssi TaxID=2898438 RepID=UPI00338FA362
MPSEPRLTVIGTGEVGSTLVELLAAAGHRVVTGSRRSARRARRAAGWAGGLGTA